MKKQVYKIFIALIALLFTFSVYGCDELPAASPGRTEAGAGSPAPTGGAPAVTGTAPQQGGVLPEASSGGDSLTEADGVGFVEKTVLYPEDATEENAQFKLSYTLPVFSDAFPAFEEMNRNVAVYEEELLERVGAERLPYADGAEGSQAPYTRVECRAERSGSYVNIYLYEFTSFGGDEELLPRILVLGPAGERESLASVTGVYEIESLAAQQVFNLIDANRNAYFGDVTLDDIPLALDLYAGFFVTDEGYGLVSPPGTLAPESDGMLVFLIERAVFYPAVVGNVISLEEFEALRGPLDTLICACRMDYAGFDSSAPPPFIATSFMTLMLTEGTEDALYVPVERSVYEETYAWYFSTPLSADFSGAGEGDGTFLKDGDYMLPVYPHEACSLRIDEAVRTEGGLVLYGMILYGVPGTSDAGELCAAAVTLKAAPDSPMGYRFESVELR